MEKCVEEREERRRVRWRKGGRGRLGSNVGREGRVRGRGGWRASEEGWAMNRRRAGNLVSEGGRYEPGEGKPTTIYQSLDNSHKQDRSRDT